MQGLYCIRVASKTCVKLYCNAQVRQVESLQGKYDVKIEIEKNKKTDRIRIQGENEAAMKAWQDVLKMLHDVENSEQEKEAAILISSQVSSLTGIAITCSLVERTKCSKHCHVC